MTELPTPKHPNYPRPWGYYVLGSVFIIVVLGILAVLTTHWHAFVVDEALVAAWKRGEQFGQGVLSPPICGAGFGHK